MDKVRSEFEVWRAAYVGGDGSPFEYDPQEVEDAFAAGWQAALSSREGEAVAWQRFHNGEWQSCTKSFHDNCLNLTGYGSDDCIYKVRALHPAHPTPDAGRVAELEQELADMQESFDEIHEIAIDYVDRLTDLESQLAASREREGRMRELAMGARRAFAWFSERDGGEVALQLYKEYDEALAALAADKENSHE